MCIRDRYRELVTFAQFGTDDLDEATKRQLGRGERSVEILKQGQNAPVPMEQQVAILFALNEGYIDDVDVSDVMSWEQAFHGFMTSNQKDLLKQISDDADLSDSSKEKLTSAIEDFKKSGLV